MKNVIFTFTLLFSVLFTVAQVENSAARVVFGNLQHDGPYDRSELLLQEKLTVSSADGHTYQIVSYKLTISPAKGSPTRFEVQGAKLPAKLQGALNQIVSGDKIVIESVMAMVNEDKHDVHMLSPIELVVKGFETNVSNDTEQPESHKTILIDSSLRATLGSIGDFSGRLSLEKILEQTEIGVYSKEGLEYEITSFKLVVAYKNRHALLASSSSGQLTSQMKEMLSNAMSEDRIIIESIKAQTVLEGVTYKVVLSPIVITVD